MRYISEIRLLKNLFSHFSIKKLNDADYSGDIKYQESVNIINNSLFIANNSKTIHIID